MASKIPARPGLKTPAQRSQSHLVLGPQIKELVKERDQLLASLKRLVKATKADMASPYITSFLTRAALPKAEKLLDKIKAKK